MTGSIRHPAAELDSGPQRARPIAVTPHHLASAAALEIMNAGGSAVDGAIAANAVLGMVLPDTCGPGGDLFALVHTPGEATPAALNASGRAGRGANAAALRDRGFDEVPLRSPWSVTVPGCVDGWEALVDRYGRLDLATLLGPAIRLGEEGFPVSEELSRSLHRIRPLIGEQGSAPALYPGAEVPNPGDMITRPHLAETLREIGAGGRTAFYDGRVGREIALATEGVVTPDDLEVRQAEWVEPIGVDVFGLTGWTIPPNSQGYLALAASWIFESLNPPEDPDDPEFLHLLIEAYRAVAWERDRTVSDPTTAPDAATLLEPARLRPFASKVDRHRAVDWPSPRPATGGTAYFCVRDASGLGASVIQSNFHGIGSGLSAGDTGVFLHNRGAGFCLEAGHPNELSPGRRPLHTLSPTLWTGAQGSLEALLGTRGGQYQPQTIVQMAAHLFHAGLSGSEAQQRPRWIVEGWEAGGRPSIHIEARLERASVEALRERRHVVVEADPWQEGWGPVSLISERDGIARGFADPRVSTSAALSG